MKKEKMSSRNPEASGAGGYQNQETCHPGKIARGYLIRDLIY